MKLDVHITTCHRPEVKCRPRYKESNKWNVREWTHEERLNISKICINSIINFSKQLEKFGHEVNVTLLNDGSSIPAAIDWMYSLKDITVKSYSPMGSSGVINSHFNDIKDSDIDYILHIEDDNILFNPLNIDWLSIINSIKEINNTIGVFTFRSGLPVCAEDNGFKGAWGPKANYRLADTECLLFNRLGNAHHIMRFDDYKQFMPLSGNTGGCESLMNDRLGSLAKINCEPQIHVHAFHSHMWKFPIESNELNAWHKTGEGYEFGIYDMDKHLTEKLPIISTVYRQFPTEKESVELTSYAY